MSKNVEQIDIIQLAKQIIPQPTETKPLNNDVMVKYGLDNLYPNFLLNLYSKCPIHHAIIDTKASYILGGGLKRKDGSDLNIKVNDLDSISSFVEKIVKDFLLFNSFAVETQYNQLTYDKEVLSYNHVPAHTVRTNKEKTKFWYSEDWNLKRTAQWTYDGWKKNNPDPTSKLFWYDGYIPSINRIYVEPDYNACIESIVTDMSIRLFNRNNITSNFSPAKLITYYLGENVPTNIQDDIKWKLDKYFSGSGEKFMLVFANPGQEKIKIENIDANTWDRAYEVTKASVKDDIYEGHSINAGLLGRETAGKLGNSQELELSYEIFKANYVQSKRLQLQEALSLLFGFEVEFVDRPLFKTRVPDSTKEKVYTINELRAMENLPPLPDGDKLLSIQSNNSTNTQVQNQQLSKVEKRLSIEDFEKVKDMGTPKNNLQFLCYGDEEQLSKMEIRLDREKDIADYVLSNDIKDLTMNQLKILIRKDLGIDLTVDILRNTLAKLGDAGVLNFTEEDGKVKIIPPVEPKIPNSRAISIMYEYDVKPGLGKPLIDTSRDFCVKLIENDRYYTREEIQKMSAIFGYDIYKFSGGYYYNPETNITTPSCRHHFVPVIVSN